MTFHPRTGRRLLLGAVPASLLAACAGGPPAPAVVDVTIQAATDINPTPSGTPVSVAVRLYSLTGRSRFEAADIYALMQREAQVLGAESTDVQEVLIRPGETRKVTLMPKLGVRAIGIAVMFRDTDRAQWRLVAPVAEVGVTRVMLFLRGTNAFLGTP